MLQVVNTHEGQKIKYSISKESNKFPKQLDLTTKEIDIKNNAIEAEKKEPKCS